MFNMEALSPTKTAPSTASLGMEELAQLRATHEELEIHPGSEENPADDDDACRLILIGAQVSVLAQSPDKETVADANNVALFSDLQAAESASDLPEADLLLIEVVADQL